MRKNYIFTSESVSEGHPDKICDQISDAILDELLKHNKHVRCACETLVKNDYVLCAGEITPNIEATRAREIIRNVIREIGYTDPALGFCADTCEIELRLGEQSADIAQGVDRAEQEQQGAGDQGLMFGYACDEGIETEYMPAPIYYAHRLMQAQAKARKQGTIDFLRPDAKSQVTLRYENNLPVAIDTIVISTQHAKATCQQIKEMKEAITEIIIKPTLPAALLKQEYKTLINPTDQFTIGGPKGDCGLTGRKIIVDTYGGMARHGGGAFSGKDPSKVDRSAAYAARYAAKNIVASGLAKRCEIQLAYAIGKAQPVSVMVDTFGSGTISDEQLEKRVIDCFDFTPYGMIQGMFDLIQPIYQATASYGHFGRTKFPWEQCDKVEALKNH